MESKKIKKILVKYLRKTLSYWNKFFTWLDNKQVLYWYKLTVYVDTLEEQAYEPRENTNLENYEDWDKVR